ncbi:phosphocholine cytidylyltransferase family protein [Roseomonas gilardii subsp. gilardii]|uniref:phosphocholine cytidylyltransferase family protein n=1 Tax=Roseomonas gilardii TaxID=257708 RepID=UPI001FF8575C|nr:phosphocholine cytidylyltransferase family protein [Roseomonas gilardii]UPG71348.1 phosphocholine cytidylyltransferase family protein [Roseomonas gilardii subsp. gilardii]
MSSYLAVPQCEAVAIILAAGVGQRLGRSDDRPKILLEFGGHTLLARHLAALEAHGIRQVAITIGYHGELIRAEVERLGWQDRVHFVENPDFRQGSLVSLAVQADTLRWGGPVLLMDGDVLYDPAMLGRLLHAPGENLLLVDLEIEPGDEPVKICFRDGLIVDFRKRPERMHDWHGESVGFFRFSPEMAGLLAARCEDYVQRGEKKVEYEEAIRDLILAEPARFQAVDISDLPWTEIDFPEDVLRAENVILPHLQVASPA